MQNHSNKYLLLIYDDTLEGLLTAIFEVYRLQLTAFDIIPEQTYKERIFQPTLIVQTNKAKANRIKIGLLKKTKQNLLPYLQHFFNQHNQKETAIYNFIQQIFAGTTNPKPVGHTTNTAV